MTADGFRAWRRRMGLSRVALLDALRGRGWSKLTIHAVNTWGVRGTPEHVDVVLGFMERHRGDWDIQRTTEAGAVSVETEPSHAAVIGPGHPGA